MNRNFRGIIVPEALKGLQRQDPTVLEMVSGLDDIISLAGEGGLSQLLVTLETHLRNAIMGMQVSIHQLDVKIPLIMNLNQSKKHVCFLSVVL